jgi:DNA-binding MarR family transcriptional regulator
MAARSDEQPISKLLSQALIAFTIEFDNEAERQISAAAGRRPWLVSLAMWSNGLRFVGEAGVPVRELQALACVSSTTLKSRLGAFERWGYVVVAPDPADSRPAPPRRDWIVRLTAGGRRARAVWQPLVGVIEQRWQTRFGNDTIADLRAALAALVGQLDVELPHALPIVSYGLFTEVLDPPKRVAAGPADARSLRTDLDLPSLLSQAVLAFTLDFERESKLSLALSANVLRVIDPTGVRVRDLPRLSGVSKEAISMAVGFLSSHGYALVEADPTASRAKLVRLTPKGQAAQAAYHRLVMALEERWQARYGSDTLRALRESLRALFAQLAGGRPRLSEGLEPDPGGWRARKPYVSQTNAVLLDPAGALPHYPMVLHRGGFPDGS